MNQLPMARPDGLDDPFWSHARHGRLAIQRCADCGTWRWTPEWICFACQSWAFTYDAVAPRGIVAAWERIWHPVHPALSAICPYLVVLVELPHAGRVRLIGRLSGDPMREPVQGSVVEAVFRHAKDASSGDVTLIDWQSVSDDHA